MKKEKPTKLRLKIQLQWKWYDLWIGLFIDTKGKTLYICPLPTVVIKIVWRIDREQS